MEYLVEPLKDNSKSAMISCVEMHNKPIFPYRYEISVILAINAWELILKAYIISNHPEIKIVFDDGSTKPFEECVSCVSSNIGKTFRAIEENLLKLYEYRCNIIHFYEEKIDVILFSLLHKNVIFYNEFLKDYFNIDLAEETNLVLIPIGFKPVASPIDFLRPSSDLQNSSKAIQTFIKSIVISIEKLNSEGIDESIVTGFKIAVINENRVNNADIIAGITNSQEVAKLTITNELKVVKVTDSETAKKIKIDEESLFQTIYVFSYYSVASKAKEIYQDFKQNKKFNDIMKGLKGNSTYHKYRYLNMLEQKGIGQDWYSSAVFDELDKHYNRK